MRPTSALERAHNTEGAIMAVKKPTKGKGKKGKPTKKGGAKKAGGKGKATTSNT